MRVEFLGSGGAIPTPRPGCGCALCAEAGAKGVPYSRGGPSLFVHGPDVLIDTPEEIATLLNRSAVAEIAACFYSHWHPDHTMGRRVWETRNKDWRNWPPRNRTTTIYLPQQVAADVKTRLGTGDHLAYLARIGVVELVEVPDGATVAVGGATVRPFRLAEPYAYAFLVAPDELFGWEPPTDLGRLDLAVLPMGVVDVHPLTGARQIPADHPVLRGEATLAQTLAVARRLDAGRVVLTHVEEPDQLSYDDLRLVEDRLREQGLPVSFAYDTMMVDV
jgi:phosphoribosyl 1,2-cyclic phosphate phosphodiesterase